jgi:ribitol 2-dehydrogenase
MLGLSPSRGRNNPSEGASQDEVDRRAEAREGLRSEDVAEAILFALTRPRNVTIRDLVMLPAGQDL